MTRAHLPWDDPRVDTLWLLVHASQTSKEADFNACELLDGDANAHWPDGPVKNHWTWIWTGKRDEKGREIRRRLTAAERATPLNKWTTKKFLRLRRAERGGRKPATVEMRQRQAKRLGVKIDWEIKSRGYRRRAAARRCLASIHRAGGKYAIMTLVTMKYWGPKLRAFKLEGARTTALLPHGAKKTAGIRAKLVIYGQYIDKYWGRWA